MLNGYMTINDGWNSFLSLIVLIKRTYEEKFKKKCRYEPILEKVNCTCVNHWVQELDIPFFKNILTGLTLWQYENFVVAHYVDYYTSIDENGESIDYNTFFKAYNGLYMECRGVVVDVEKERLVLVPFRKFMNLNECEDTTLERINKRISDAKCIEFTEKLDGSMISARIYEDELVLSGSSCNHPDKSVCVKNSYDYIQQHKEYMELLLAHRNLTFIFEHIFPRIDPHIVQYKNEGLYLIGIRNNDTGLEASYKEVIGFAQKYNILTTKIFNTSLTDVLKHLDDKKANEAEGFVLNVDHFKVKIKYNDYIWIHKTIAGLVTPNGVIKAMADNKIDDLISKMPESYKETVFSYRKEISEIIYSIGNKVCRYFNHIKDLPKKEAMIWINVNVPRKYQCFVRGLYLGNDVSYLKTYSGHYKTYQELKELEISN